MCVRARGAPLRPLSLAQCALRHRQRVSPRSGAALSTAFFVSSDCFFGVLRTVVRAFVLSAFCLVIFSASDLVPLSPFYVVLASSARVRLCVRVCVCACASLHTLLVSACVCSFVCVCVCVFGTRPSSQLMLPQVPALFVFSLFSLALHFAGGGRRGSLECRIERERVGGREGVEMRSSCPHPPATHLLPLHVVVFFSNP